MGFGLHASHTQESLQCRAREPPFKEALDGKLQENSEIPLKVMVAPISDGLQGSSGKDGQVWPCQSRWVREGLDPCSRAS